MTKQTPWFERRFNFDFNTGLFPVVFSRLEGAIFRLYSLLSNADDEVCSVSAEGVWSVKEQVGHLGDLEALWWQRLNDFLQHKTHLTIADLQNTGTTEAGDNNNTLEKLIERFTLERQRLLEAVYTFGEEELLRTALHPRLNQPMRTIDHLFFIAEHDDHHISSISNLLRRPIG